MLGIVNLSEVCREVNGMRLVHRSQPTLKYKLRQVYLGVGGGAVVFVEEYETFPKSLQIGKWDEFYPLERLSSQDMPS